ncbi:MAG TPA: pyruvate kinase alpha/beta domain-containing protein [Desulfobacteria bacterium]|nr:pyruvate kinase alpha/beta domain-containing protein [Desulfobacteria bacterium]
MEAATTYFAQPGPVNTADTVQIALRRARELNIKQIVVASNSGATVEQFVDQGFKLVWVTHQAGFAGPGKDEVDPEIRQRLQAKGVQTLTTTHLMAGIDRALRIKAGGVYPAEIVAHTLRIFGQGVKVGIECSVMALDAGLIPYDVPVLAVGGSGRGADTALVLRPAYSNEFFATKIIEICCKPRLDQ